MTCQQFRDLRRNKHVFRMTAAERAAMVRHHLTCAACRTETQALAKRGRKMTPTEDAELERILARDLLDPEAT